MADHPVIADPEQLARRLVNLGDSGRPRVGHQDQRALGTHQPPDPPRNIPVRAGRYRIRDVPVTKSGGRAHIDHQCALGHPGVDLAQVEHSRCRRTGPDQGGAGLIERPHPRVVRRVGPGGEGPGDELARRLGAGQRIIRPLCPDGGRGGRARSHGAERTAPMGGVDHHVVRKRQYLVSERTLQIMREAPRKSRTEKVRTGRRAHHQRPPGEQGLGSTARVEKQVSNMFGGMARRGQHPQTSGTQFDLVSVNQALMGIVQPGLRARPQARAPPRYEFAAPGDEIVVHVGLQRPGDLRALGLRRVRIATRVAHRIDHHRAPRSPVDDQVRRVAQLRGAKGLNVDSHEKLLSPSSLREAALQRPRFVTDGHR